MIRFCLTALVLFQAGAAMADTSGKRIALSMRLSDDPNQEEARGSGNVGRNKSRRQTKPAERTAKNPERTTGAFAEAFKKAGIK